MCFPEGSLPPAPPGPAREIRAEPVVVGAGRAYHARVTDADRPAPVAAVVLPDGRGLRRYYERFAECLAGAGIDALAVDLYGRTAGTGSAAAGGDTRPQVN